jgi:hypothetical protein
MQQPHTNTTALKLIAVVQEQQWDAMAVTSSSPKLEKEFMRTKTNMKLGTFKRKLAWMMTSAALSLLVVGCAQSSVAQESRPKTFSSPGEASNALFQAVQNEDEQGVEAILGAGKEVTSSSDEVEDKLERERFSQKYQEMHRLVREPDGKTVLYIGAENWPFPIPLVSENGVWHFDSKTGMQEVLFRRIGENEATAIEVCHAVVMVKKQQEATSTEDAPIRQYAQSLLAPDADNTVRSKEKEKESSPFHGYIFRVVPANSAAGTNGSVSGGKSKKTGGLALVAYPAEYKSSGVMTFVVTQKGGVYEKDLGPNTTTVAPDVQEHKPDSSWHAAE